MQGQPRVAWASWMCWLGFGLFGYGLIYRELASEGKLDTFGAPPECIVAFGLMSALGLCIGRVVDLAFADGKFSLSGCLWALSGIPGMLLGLLLAIGLIEWQGWKHQTIVPSFLLALGANLGVLAATWLVRWRPRSTHRSLPDEL